MRKLKNSHKILSLVLLGIFLISIIILPNNNIVDDDRVYDNNPILLSEQTDQSFDNTVDIKLPQMPASAPKDNQTFSITQEEDDAHNLMSLTDCYKTSIILGAVDKDDPNLGYISLGTALRWDINIPKYAHITKAYINLTVANLTSFGMPWTGFNTSISAFEQASTNDFSDTGERLKLRPQTSQIPWELNGTETINQTIQTTNVADLLQQIMVLDGWDGIFGVFIQPGVGTDNIFPISFEVIEFWAFDYGKPDYYPKLFVEWDYIPHFTDTPEDKYFFEKADGYSLKWQVWDNDPDTFKITCNVSIPGIPYYDTWTSGWVTYDLPALDRGFYNFTAYFNDTDGHLIWDSIIVEAGPPKPIISSGTYKIDRSADDATYQPKKGSAFAHTGTSLQLGGSTSYTSEDQRVICLRFNTAVPKHAHIKRAYVNLTVSGLSNYGGFTSEIHLFYPPVADFTDDNDLFTLYYNGLQQTRPSNFYRIIPFPPLKPIPKLILPPSLSQDVTIQTPDLTSNLQEVIDFDSYNGYIGLFIVPTAGINSINEKINFYSYEGAINAYKLQFTPTLFIEWEESPYFLSTPANIIAKNRTRGYYLEWTAADDNPTTFTITCNDTVSNIPYTGVWQSGIESSYNIIFDNNFKYKVENITTTIRYDLPPLEIGVYNFTIRINDEDSWYNLDSVIVTVSDLDLPVLTDIKFVQNGKEVDYFQCGNGPFTLQIYSNTPITPMLWLTAYYPGYEQYFYSTAIYTFTVWRPFELIVSISGDTYTILQYNIPYKPVLGCYEFTPPPNSNYSWNVHFFSASSMYVMSYMYKGINNIEYNVLNRFEVRINGNDQYIYNQTIYGDIWARPIEVWNKDLTPPTYSEPEVIEPDEPDKHYEVNIWAGTEAYGAKIDEVILYYSVDNGPWEETEMILKDGKYYGEIPAQEEGATIDYYLKIIDIAGNSIETEEYHEKAPTFEEPSVMIPVLGILLGILGALSIVMIYRHKRKAALKKLTSDKIAEKSTSDTQKGNILFQKLKKVRTKQ